MVGVGISVGESVGVPVGIGTGPEQATRTNPHAARHRIKICFSRMVSFIVLKTGRIVSQGVVQSNQTLRSACLYLHSTACYLNLAILFLFSEISTASVLYWHSITGMSGVSCGSSL